MYVYKKGEMVLTTRETSWIGIEMPIGTPGIFINAVAWGAARKSFREYRPKYRFADLVMVYVPKCGCEVEFLLTDIEPLDKE